MSQYELLSVLVAIVSVIISTVALRRTRKTETRQLKLQEAQAHFAAFQHKVLTAEHEAGQRADLRIELCKSGRDTYFEFSNVGASSAKNVSFTFCRLGPRKTPLVFTEQFNQIFPIAEFMPNETHRLRAILSLDTPPVLEGEFTWQDVNGAIRNRKCTLAL